MAETKEVAQKAGGVSYQAADGQEITLTLDIVKKYLVQGKGELVTMQEFMYFVNICRARKLNPLVKDCYLIKYGADPAAIVTSIDFYRKRSRAQKDCKGWKKGCIVKTKDGQVKDTYGLVQDDETLIGGWFEAHPEGWLEPFRLEVNLKGYIKKTNEGKITKFWAPENQPTMISKVAEGQGLRTLWTDEFQGTYVEEEISGMDFGSLPGDIDVKPEADGDLVKRFTDSIPKGTIHETLDAFMAKTAESNKATVEAVILEAVKNDKSLKDFWKFYGAWEKQNKAKTAKEPEQPARFNCSNGGFATLLVCAECKDREPTEGDECPAYHQRRIA